MLRVLFLLLLLLLLLLLPHPTPTSVGRRDPKQKDNLLPWGGGKRQKIPSTMSTKYQLLPSTSQTKYQLLPSGGLAKTGPKHGSYTAPTKPNQ